MCELALADNPNANVPVLHPALDEAVRRGGASDKVIMDRLDHARDLFAREMWFGGRMLEVLDKSNESYLTKTVPGKGLWDAILQAQAVAANAARIKANLREAAAAYHARSYWGGWPVSDKKPKPGT